MNTVHLPNVTFMVLHSHFIISTGYDMLWRFRPIKYGVWSEKETCGKVAWKDVVNQEIISDTATSKAQSKINWVIYSNLFNFKYFGIYTYLLSCWKLDDVWNPSHILCSALGWMKQLTWVWPFNKQSGKKWQVEVVLSWKQ